MQGGYHDMLRSTLTEVVTICRCGRGSFEEDNHYDISKVGRGHAERKLVETCIIWRCD